METEIRKHIRIGRAFKFDAAHRLESHQGLCKYTHGHTWTLTVELGLMPGVPVAHGAMLLDFADFKDIIQDQVLRHLDHADINASDTVLPNGADPTCEALVEWIAARLMPVFQLHGLQLLRLRLQEGGGGYAIWEEA